MLHLGRVGSWILAAVFLAAAIPKLASPGDFSKIIGMYGLAPNSLVYPIAIVLPIVEIATAIGLLLFRQWGLALAAIQLFFFIAILSYGIHLGLDIDCGCFGPGDPEHEALSGLRTALLRDVFFIVLAGYSWWALWYSKKQIIKEKKSC